MSERPALRAVVLARGLGTRMRAADAGGAALDAAQASAAEAGMKAMIPFEGGRPFLDHALHRLAEAGVRQVGLIIGPEHERIRSYYRTLQTRRLAIDCLTQERPLGTADAVASAEPWIGDAPFLVLNGDNLYPLEVLERLVGASAPALPAFDATSLDLPLEKIATCALLERDSRGCLSAITEKPGEEAMRAAGPHALVSLNVWRFDGRIFRYCREVPVSSRGEQELPQAVGLAAADGLCLQMFDARGPVIDLSRRSDVAAVARALEGARVDL